MIDVRPPRENELHEMYLLRWKLNRKPFGLPKGTETDKHEANSYKIVAVDSTHKVVGSARLHIVDNVGEINFMGVRQDFQMKGIGKKLVDALEHYAKEKNVQKLFFLQEKLQNSFM